MQESITAVIGRELGKHAGQIDALYLLACELKG